MQMREYSLEKGKLPQHSMLLVTPLKALYVDCTEVSQTFNEEGIEGMKVRQEIKRTLDTKGKVLTCLLQFYADLYHLMKGTSGISTRKKVQSAPLEQVNTLADLLIETRLLSFS